MIKTLQEDENGNLFLDISECCEELGWKEGDVLIWKDMGDGTYLLSKRQQVFESPDKGKTIFVRNFGEKERVEYKSNE